MRQFLVEAVVLSGRGGIIGVVVGVGVTLGAAALIPHIHTTVSPPVFTVAVILAFGVSVLVGLVARSYPAYRAARLHPIDALRLE
jgi:putative ABC transport system permease protein